MTRGFQELFAIDDAFRGILADAIFFRAQRIVRRALLAVGTERARAGALDGAWQIFELPIRDVRRGIIEQENGVGHAPSLAWRVTR